MELYWFPLFSTQKHNLLRKVQQQNSSVTKHRNTTHKRLIKLWNHTATDGSGPLKCLLIWQLFKPKICEEPDACTYLQYHPHKKLTTLQLMDYKANMDTDARTESKHRMWSGKKQASCHEACNRSPFSTTDCEAGNPKSTKCCTRLSSKYVPK